MKHIYSALALFIIISNPSILCASTNNNSLSFRLLESEYGVNSAIKPGLDINIDNTELFSKDNIIYAVNKTQILDESAISCVEMLGSSYSHDSNYTPNPSFKYNIIFKTSKVTQLLNTGENIIGKRLAIVFNKKILIAPVVKETISDGSIYITELSYNDAKQIGYAIYKVCAWASNVSFRMVHPDNKTLTETPHLKDGINLNEYESLSMGDQKYWISRKVQLGHNGFKEANILVDVYDPSAASQSSEVALESIPFTLNEEEEAARNERIFKVRINLNEKGRDELKSLSENDAGRELATVFEGRLFHIETIPEKSKPEFVLINYLTYNEAKRLTDAINRGSTSSEGAEK